jgi:hypothetical protein
VTGRIAKQSISKLTRVSILLLLAAIPSFSQTDPSKTSKTAFSSPPHNIRLLDGYSWTAGITIDAAIGRITGETGFLINYSTSGVRGFYSRSFSERSDLVWLKSQVYNGQSLDLALLKSGEFTVLFDKTSIFSAKPKTDNDLADFLLMAMTFDSGAKAGPDVPKISAPGNIALPAGYAYEPGKGIDSSVGAFKRDDGFTISHDIGRMAGIYAGKYFPEHFEILRKQTHLSANAIQQDIDLLQNQVLWRRKQMINGEEVLIVMLKDSRLIASFPSSNANFTATADSSDKIADFFLIVLTFHPTPKS